MQRKVEMSGWRRRRVPLGNRAEFCYTGPQGRARCYLGLVGAEVPYANDLLVGEKELLQMALCNLL